MKSRPTEMHLLIATYNRPKMLDRLLSSIAAANLPASLKHVHIVENGSQVAEDIAMKFSAKLPVVYHHFAEGNKSKALNNTLTKITPEALLVFFDDDLKIDANVLERFEEVSQRYGPGHFFGGGLRAEYEKLPDPSVLPYLPRSAREYDLAKGKDTIVFEHFYAFLGANWACYHKDLAAAGNFAVHLGPGSKSGARGQETDAQYRLAANGLKAVAIGNSLVDHWVPEKFVQPDWLVERIYQSAIHLGQEKASLVKTMGLLAKLVYSLVQYGLGNRSIGPRYRIAKAAGYLRGLVS